MDKKRLTELAGIKTVNEAVKTFRVKIKPQRLSTGTIETIIAKVLGVRDVRVTQPNDTTVEVEVKK